MIEEFEVLQQGDKEKRKKVLKHLSKKNIKTLFNVIMNVEHNPCLHVSRKQRKALKPYTSTISKLADKKLKWKKKVKLLQKTGHKYLPILLKIIGDDLEDCMPKERTRRNCPLCSAENLAKLSNHLINKHHLSPADRETYLSRKSPKS